MALVWVTSRPISGGVVVVVAKVAVSVPTTVAPPAVAGSPHVSPPSKATIVGSQDGAKGAHKAAKAAAGAELTGQGRMAKAEIVALVAKAGVFLIG
mmetsp:Transcript_68106/g.137009  ORF Transcript_68106/g.137009 Transcript_68106/m.137009 type:complete len:96 (+) Transcript_68106:296-583(+)